MRHIDEVIARRRCRSRNSTRISARNWRRGSTALVEQQHRRENAIARASATAAAAPPDRRVPSGRILAHLHQVEGARDLGGDLGARQLAHAQP